MPVYVVVDQRGKVVKVTSKFEAAAKNCGSGQTVRVMPYAVLREVYGHHPTVIGFLKKDRVRKERLRDERKRRRETRPIPPDDDENSVLT